jgi:hypothetical protein
VAGGTDEADDDAARDAGLVAARNEGVAGALGGTAMPDEAGATAASDADAGRGAAGSAAADVRLTAES